MSTELDKQARVLFSELFFAKTQATKEKLILEAFSQVREQSKWVSVASGTLPEIGQIVDVWIVDDNSKCGGKRREYADIWEYDPKHPGWTNSWVTHWAERPAPPETTEQEERGRTVSEPRCIVRGCPSTIGYYTGGGTHLCYIHVLTTPGAMKALQGQKMVALVGDSKLERSKAVNNGQ